MQLDRAASESRFQVVSLFEVREEFTEPCRQLFAEGRFARGPFFPGECFLRHCVTPFVGGAHEAIFRSASSSFSWGHSRRFTVCPFSRIEPPYSPGCGVEQEQMTALRVGHHLVPPDSERRSRHR